MGLINPTVLSSVAMIKLVHDKLIVQHNNATGECGTKWGKWGSM